MCALRQNIEYSHIFCLSPTSFRWITFDGFLFASLATHEEQPTTDDENRFKCFIFGAEVIPVNLSAMGIFSETKYAWFSSLDCNPLPQPTTDTGVKFCGVVRRRRFRFSHWHPKGKNEISLHFCVEKLHNSEYEFRKWYTHHTDR